jgi:predicted nucleic acid-binding protein
MSTSRIYIDTSVIGGCFDVEFAEYSNRLFQAFYTKRWVAVVSDITFNELLNAPQRVRTQLDTLPESAIERVRLDEEANELAQKYLAAGILKTAQLADAQHIAIATLERVEVIVSWNFKHIVNLNKIRGFNSINIREGYPLLEIRTPREVIADDTERV